MASVHAKDDSSTISSIMSFWFEKLGPKGWFGPDASQWDDEIIKRYSTLVEEARDTSSLDHWTSTPSGALALVILLDQFPRVVYRVGNHDEPGLSWASDEKGLRIASQAISKGFDTKIQQEYSAHKGFGYRQRSFFYLPFMHAENLAVQVGGVSLYKVMLQDYEKSEQHKTGQHDDEAKEVRGFLEYGVEFAKKHQTCVATLGLFPARNEPLGREMRQEDREWLDNHPQGF